MNPAKRQYPGLVVGHAGMTHVQLSDVDESTSYDCANFWEYIWCKDEAGTTWDRCPPWEDRLITVERETQSQQVIHVWSSRVDGSLTNRTMLLLRWAWAMKGNCSFYGHDLHPLWQERPFGEYVPNMTEEKLVHTVVTCIVHMPRSIGTQLLILGMASKRNRIVEVDHIYGISLPTPQPILTKRSVSFEVMLSAPSHR